MHVMWSGSGQRVPNPRIPFKEINTLCPKGEYQEIAVKACYLKI